MTAGGRHSDFVGDEDSDTSPGIRAEEIFTHTRRALLLGPAGSGKTTLLQWFCTQVVGRELTGRLARLNAYTPFFVRLREYNERELPTGNQVVAAASRALVDFVPKDWVRNILDEEKAIFLIDGLDELTSARHPAVSRWLEELVELSPQSYFIITSRPASLDLTPFHKLEFAEFALQRMSPKEVRTFIDYWHAGLDANCRSNDIIVDLERKKREVDTILTESRSLARLASSPLLCAIICTLNFKAQLRVATSRNDLYRTAVRLLVHERDSLKQVTDPIYDLLSYDDKERLLSETAYWLVRNDKVTVSNDELISFLSKTISPQQIERWEHGLQFSDARGETTRDQVIKMTAAALVVRSGLLQQVGVDEIQFVHKTFQEYLASISIRWHDDELLLIKSLDIRRWNELVILTVTTTTQSKSKEMLRLLLKRGQASTDSTESNYCYLLAASCLRETYGVDRDLQNDILSHLANLLPPDNMQAVEFLAGAGDLVTPLLEYKSNLSRNHVAYTIETLTYIDTSESRRLILDYATKAEISDDLVDAIVLATSYIEDMNFIKDSVKALIARNSPVFVHKVGRNNALRIANPQILRWSEHLPRFSALRADGSRHEKIITVLADSDIQGNGIRRLDIVHVNERMRCDAIRNHWELREINWFDIDSIASFEFLSTGNIRRMRLLDVREIFDVDGFGYNDSLEELYLESIDEEALREILSKMAKRKKCSIYAGETTRSALIEMGGSYRKFVKAWERSDIEKFCLEFGSVHH